MLLFTAITFGGQDLEKLFVHLPEDEAELLKHQAEEILKIPRDNRIPFLVKEMKRLVASAKGRLGLADPQQLSLILMGESPSMVEVVLRALPVLAAESVRHYLTGRKEIRLNREVKPEILNIIRWKLEELVASRARQGHSFKFSDLTNLSTASLVSVCERLGLQEVSRALTGISQDERQAWIEKAPSHVQPSLERNAKAKFRSLPNERQNAIAPLLFSKDWKEALLILGIHSVARSALAHSPEYSARLIERHRGTFGQQLAQAVREERKRLRSEGMGAGTEDERMEVVRQVQLMEKEGSLVLPQIKSKSAALEDLPSPSSKPGRTSVQRNPRRGNGSQSG